MNIKIIGSNCSNGIKLKKNLLKAVSDFDERIEIEFKDDLESVQKYNIKNKPALIVDGKVCSQGNVLTPREISKFIKQYSTN